MIERPPQRRNSWLAMNPMQRVIGIVLVMIGGVWFLQGIGVAKGSVMTGSTLWAILGVVFLIAGVVVLRRKPRPADDDVPPSRREEDPDATGDTRSD